MTANIRPKVPPHSECWRRGYDITRGRLDDVRYCEHGKVQVLSDVSSTAPMQGPGMWWWKDLSPVLNPIRYKQAVRALATSKG